MADAMLPTFVQKPTGPAKLEVPAVSPDREIPIRPTRKQVSRACDWCRARRIKCDNGRPCRACRQRGADCTHKGTNEPRTLPMALKEIEKLRARVQELQAELDAYKSREHQSVPTPSETSIATSPSSTRDQRGSQNGHSSTQASSPSPSVVSKPQWDGIFIATSRSDQTSYYGPSSHFYFVSRIGAYLNKALQQPCAPRSMQPKEARRNAALTNPNEAEEREIQSNQVVGGLSPSPTMTRTQEEYFLSLFWESYHCLMPVIDEVEFRRHYASLWEPSKPHRKNSPLVDIVLAICLQYGYSFISRDAAPDHRDPSSDDATMAGRWYYRRGQSLLAADFESPTITTVQCLIFSMCYLCCASFQNMAHITVAQAVRTAQILGLHLEPPADMPLADRELRKRIWWILSATESKVTAKLGRFGFVDRSQVTVTQPSDDIETASANGATLGSYGNVTWLTYNLQMQKLSHVSFDIHQPLYAKFGEALERSGTNSLYKDSQALESCAEFLAVRLPALKAWADQLPSSIKSPRRQGGEPFAIDRTPLDIDPLAPTWLQRQRICLELLYHSQFTNLCRPFITFYSNASTYTPIAERHAAACVHHAIAHTLIMHQVVTETDFMCGWSEFFFWQWNAAISIVGFVLAYPIHSSTSNARKALDKAVAVFDVFGANFSVAADAADIIRDLTSKADQLAGRLRSGIMAPPGATPEQQQQPAECPAAVNGGAYVTNTNGDDDGLAWLDPSEQNDPNYFSEFMDWAMSVDQFNNFEHFFNSNNPTNAFQFGQ